MTLAGKPDVNLPGGAWESDRDYRSDQLRDYTRVIWDRRIYRFVQARSTSDHVRSGTRQPTHREYWSLAWDGYGTFIDNGGNNLPAGILWRYDNCGYGIGTIKA